MSDTPLTPQVPATAPSSQAPVPQPVQPSQPVVPVPVQAPTDGASS
ncbi:MAG: hypothetical protein LBO09_07995 [Candidatus Peribacteria bacterium]|jgi:hypothetical protein|nr:hypothetical protein [Candidatus Peribacteria bacterium]